jgi:hypothetical protein
MAKKVVQEEESKQEALHPDSEEPDAFAIFLFVNPKSGSRKGKLLLDHEFRAIKFALKDGTVGKMNIISIIDSQQKASGYKELRY